MLPSLWRIEIKTQTCIGTRLSTRICAAQQHWHKSPAIFTEIPKTRWHCKIRNTIRVQPYYDPCGADLALAHSNRNLQNLFHSLPSEQFQVLLTSISRCSSSFDHSTCLLSVSGQYLALEDTYPPFCTPRPKSATRSLDSGCTYSSTWTGLSPFLVVLSRNNYAGSSTRKPAKDYNALQATLSTLSHSRFSRPY